MQLANAWKPFFSWPPMVNADRLTILKWQYIINYKALFLDYMLLRLYQTLEHAQGFSWSSWFSRINMYQIRICINTINIYHETNSKINMFMALVHILKFKNFYFVDATSFNISGVIKQSITVFTSTILSSNFWWTNGSFCSNVSMNNLTMGRVLMHKLRWSSFLLHIWRIFW